ncbi:hypothetical protein [Pleurocapsa sp. PCC 7319]|uniref:hypothetical protein n=1 Tax=Pleurocapsa sp. PCC 7319 TaxID=118161 RepID=UPI000349DA94|nr:hypothetical protein [Pleurocapsa sp. PCC 7319]
MKLIGLAWGLLSIYGSLLSFDRFTSPAVAQCVQADISVQYNISGSQEPTERTNDVDFQNTGACHGNVSVTTGVQGNVGGNGRVRQNRIVRHRIENGNGNNSYSDHSIVQIKSNPAIDVYNAADNLKY